MLAALLAADLLRLLVWVLVLAGRGCRWMYRAIRKPRADAVAPIALTDHADRTIARRLAACSSWYAHLLDNQRPDDSGPVLAGNPASSVRRPKVACETNDDRWTFPLTFLYPATLLQWRLRCRKVRDTGQCLLWLPADDRV